MPPLTPSEPTCQRLSELKTNEEGVITRVFGHGSFRNRITEMGFIRGKGVKVIRNAPLQDPVEYEIMGYRIALRRSEAELIEVSTGAESPATEGSGSQGTFSQQSANRFLHEAGHVINVALVGNPNSGKTSLFNMAAGAHEHVGNYSGVTVDAKRATFRHKGYTIHLSDLPGTYSITEFSTEELYVREHILQKMPDVVINVVDASNLERNLYLTTQLIDMDLKVVMALNMYDELEGSGAQLDYPALGNMLGIPMVPTVASQQTGLGKLFDTVIDVFEDNEPIARHIHIHYGADIERAIDQLQERIWKNADISARYSTRYLAIKLLEGDYTTLKLLKSCPNYGEIAQSAAREKEKLEKEYGEDGETIIADAKYGFIAGALEETYIGETHDKHARTSRIDHVVTDKIWGLPIFLGLMALMFQATFTLGAYPAQWIESAVGALGDWVYGIMNPGSLRDLITEGIIGGVGGVIVFLPNILILFFFISLMEDTGYMARAAFIMDKLMHKMGLHGKSFIPLLMGFGCNVPAIMATRMLESRKDRVLTMLILPFVSCSARLPVYVLLISAFFPRYQGLVLFSIYLAGIAIAIISSLIFKKVFFKKAEAPFVMELPPYRIPTGRSVVRHMWHKGSQYLRKMGTVILVASVLIWALGHYPVGDPSLSPAQQQEQSYIGSLGKAVEPVIRPLGFDWQIGISLLTGLAAKEIVVSTMAVLSGPSDGTDAAGPGSVNLTEKLRQMTYTEGPKMGEKVYTPLVAYTLMLFILLYFPCVAALAAIRREAGGRWAFFAMCYTTGVAWLVSFAVFQIGSLF